MLSFRKENLREPKRVAAIRVSLRKGETEYRGPKFLYVEQAQRFAHADKEAKKAAAEKEASVACLRGGAFRSAAESKYELETKVRDQRKGWHDPIGMLGVDFFKKGRAGKALRKQDLIIMEEALRGGDTTPPTFDDHDLARQATCEDIYDRALKALEQHTTSKTEGKDIELRRGTFVPMPPPALTRDERKRGMTNRLTAFIGGPQGSGKSVLSGELAEQWKRIHPKGKIYLFSKCDKDPALDWLHPIRIALDPAIKSAEPAKFKGSLCIFDDVDVGTNKEILADVQRLRDDLLENGRKQNVSVITTSHLFSDWQRTRKAMNETELLCFFPHSGSTFQIKNVLKNYIGLDKPTIERVLNLPSRWVCISRVSPQFVLCANSAFMLAK